MRILALLLAFALSACSTPGGKRTIVASIYPLAFAAERVVGPEWDVIDLTPPGVEAHDLDLTLEQQAAIEDADLVMYLGDIGFQPQVEAAVEETEGSVYSMADALAVHDRSEPTAGDPHVWLDLEAMAGTSHAIAVTLGSVVESERSDFSTRAADVASRFRSLDAEYREGLSDCLFHTAIVTHEAFGFLLERYGLQQYGLSGNTPEAEPTASRLAGARELIDRDEAGAVFFEESAREIAESFAGDIDVAALPLSTLESRPVEGDYFTAMEDNLESLREGLQCR